MRSEIPQSPLFLSRVFASLIDIFFPRECLVTGKFPGRSPYLFISEEGRQKLSFIDKNCCRVCGSPFSGTIIPQNHCAFCKDRNFHFEHSRSAILLNASARKIVHAVKYGSVHAAIKDLARIATESDTFSRYLENAILVPVPLSPKRQARRGYNQSLIFAYELSRRLAGTQCQDLLVRTRDTGTQTQLSAEARRRNVRAAFSVSTKIKTRLSKELRYVIIDDVFTTGSTLSECALALKKAGAKNVDAATFSHG